MTGVFKIQGGLPSLHHEIISARIQGSLLPA